MLIEPQPLAVRRTPAGPGAASVEIDFELAPDFEYFPDHFPGRPMLPGVVQLGWALRFAAREFGIAAPFKRLAQLKFQHPILPGRRVTLRLQRSSDTEVSFSYTAQRPCSSGRLLFG